MAAAILFLFLPPSPLNRAQSGQGIQMNAASSDELRESFRYVPVSEQERLPGENLLRRTLV